MSNVIVSSYPKSGTMLIRNIIRMITGNDNLNDKYADKLLPLGIKQLDGYIRKDAENVFKLGNELSEISSQNLCVEAQIIDKHTNCQYAAVSFRATEAITKILDSDPHVDIETHASPSQILSNQTISRFSKKIYLYRRFQSVYNSRMKYMDNTEITASILNLLKNQKSLQRYNYNDISRFHLVLNEWKEHLNSYMEYKDSFFGLSYEDLCANPRENIRSLADYLETDISGERITDIISVCLNKELSGWKLKPSHAKHYNPERKDDDYKLFFTEYMNDHVKQNIGNILAELGYDVADTPDDLPADYIAAQQKAVELYEKNNTGYIQQNYRSAMADGFINSLAGFIAGRSIVLYGAGLYTARLVNRLKDRCQIAFIVDDNPAKAGTNIDGIEICTPNRLLSDYGGYSYILISVVPQHTETVRQRLIHTYFTRPYDVLINAYNEYVDDDSTEAGI